MRPEDAVTALVMCFVVQPTNLAGVIEQKIILHLKEGATIGIAHLPEMSAGSCTQERKLTGTINDFN